MIESEYRRMQRQEQQQQSAVQYYENVPEEIVLSDPTERRYTIYLYIYPPVGFFKFSLQSNIDES